MANLVNWTEVVDHADFSPRWGHRTITWNNKIWLIGGVLVGSTRNADVWSTTDGSSWTLEGSGAFGPKSHFVLLEHDDKLWILGGTNNISPYYTNDVWNSTDGVSWSLVTSGANWPIRHEHCGWTLNDKMYIGTGQGDGLMYDDCWSSADGISWTQLSASVTGTARRESAHEVFNGRMYIYGGNASGYHNDQYSSADGIIWSAHGNAQWGARREHQAIVFNDGQSMAIIGGYDGSQLDDVWISNDGTSWVSATGHAPFPARSDLAIAGLNEHVYVIGGLNGVTELDDVWYTDDIPPEAQPVPDNKVITNYQLVLSNQRISPYRAPSMDRLQTKVQILRNRRLSHKRNVNIELWTNQDTSWAVRTSGVTNRYGIASLTYPCSNISGIECCLGYTKAIIDGEEFTSNTTRFNFVSGVSIPPISFLIDAGFDYPIVSGLTLDTYMYDDFKTGTMDSWWNPLVTEGSAAFHLRERAGEWTVDPNHVEALYILPSGTDISGNFIFESDVIPYETYFSYYDNARIGVYLDIDTEWLPSFEINRDHQGGSGGFTFSYRNPLGSANPFVTSGYYFPFSGEAHDLVRLTREGSNIHGYIKPSSTGNWIEISPPSGISIGGNSIAQFGMGAKYDSISPWFGYIKLEADGGLPYQYLGSFDRSGFDTFDSSGRLNIYDRMYGGT